MFHNYYLKIFKNSIWYFAFILNEILDGISDHSLKIFKKNISKYAEEL